MKNEKKCYDTEKEGQIAFFKNYSIDYEGDNSILVDNTDGVYHGNILEFKLNISNTGQTLFQAIKYLSRMRIKGESIPARILLVDLNATKVYEYNSIDYIEDIQKVYIGAASKNNELFAKNVTPVEEYDYTDMVDSEKIKKILINKVSKENDWYIPIDLDEDCIVGWAKRYYREIPHATKGDFLGDGTGKINLNGEIREPKHFKGLINPYTAPTNEKFKYLMDCLNDRMNKKDLGAFYTPEVYCQKAAELVEMAVASVPEGNDYIILDRCAGTGNLEAALYGKYDKNGDELISHCVVSTYEYYEYKVLLERIGQDVRNIIPPTEANVIYANGKISNADAMSKDYIENPLIKQYIENSNCTIIIFENPPYDDTSSIRQAYNEDGNKHITKNKESYVYNEMKKVKKTFNNSNISTVRDTANRFIWNGFEYYMRQDTDSYILFSPVKYFKSLGIFSNPDKRFVKGYMFNRKHFHASASSIGCIYWTYGLSKNSKLFDFEIFDIEDSKLSTLENMIIKTVNTTLSASNTKYVGQKVGTLSSNNRGEEAVGKKCETTIYIDDEVIGYFCPVSESYNIGRLPYFNGRGSYILKSNFKDIAVLFSAKMYDFNKWYEKGSIFITYDGGTAYRKDKELKKACLIYTCLSDKNNCLSFNGSDGIFYSNELCFDTTKGETVASVELSKATLNSEEEKLMNTWNNILAEAKKTKNYNKDLTYGVYQITKELNTYHIVGTGTAREKIPDYPNLNGYLVSLRNNLKEYYNSHIKKKLFKYELLK